VFFAKTYIGEQITRRQYILWSLLPLVVLAATPTGLNIISVDAYGLNTKTGNIYYLILVEFVVYFTVGLALLRRYYNKKSTDVVHKQQLRYIFVGVVLTLIPGVIANAVLPILGVDTAVFFGPSAVIFLAFFTSIAIIKHRLLDIRLIVARSLGYILSLSTLGILFGLLAFIVVGQLLFPDTQVPLPQQAFYALSAVILATSFQPTKNFFSRSTSRIFYRDAYESQHLLDQLNKVLVSNIELQGLLTKASDVVATTIKAEFCMFGIEGVTASERRVIGTRPKLLDDKDTKEFQKMVEQAQDKTIVTDELEDTSQKLQFFLRDYDIAVLLRLTDSPEITSNGVGYIALGPKKSGSPYTSQDIKILEIIADEMVIAIQNALRFEEIQQFAETLQAKVDDATRKLRRTNEKLKALDETKDEFISMASHQLRTPLTSVKGYVSMVLEEDAGKINKQQRKLLDQAFVSSQRMVYLIADLLNVSRLRTGKFVIEAKPTNLADVIEGEVSQLIETAKARNLTLTYHKPKNFPALNLDETKTRQVIMNFVDNAIYYTPSGGHITINLEDKGKSIEYSVVDDGIGVPKSEQHHLFGKFYRAGNAKKARPDGTGLGLFMAKKVVVAQGGAVIFHSEEGKGSTFGFNFPKAKLIEHATPDSKDADK
jgi:signal transduction histidine kinase